jgi:hypothetical protein
MFCSILPAKMEVDYASVYEPRGRPCKTPAEPGIAKEPLPNNGQAITVFSQ